MNVIENLDANLKTLRMPFVREHYQDTAKHATAKGLGHIDYLHTLVCGEADQREQRAIKRRIKAAAFPFLRTLDMYDFTHPQQVDRMHVTDLFTLRFIKDAANVVFVGNTGLGKTHLAVSLAHHACLNGHKVLYTSASSMVNDLISAQAAHRLPDALKRYIRPAVLLVDELGYLPIDKLGADLLFQVISGRYERGSIILTTNLIFKNWTPIFSDDATLTSAALDRLLHHHELIIIKGKSYRGHKPVE